MGSGRDEAAAFLKPRAKNNYGFICVRGREGPGGGLGRQEGEGYDEEAGYGGRAGGTQPRLGRGETHVSVH